MSITSSGKLKILSRKNFLHINAPSTSRIVARFSHSNPINISYDSQNLNFRVKQHSERLYNGEYHRNWSTLASTLKLPVKWSFNVFIYIIPNKMLNNWLNCRRFNMPWRSYFVTVICFMYDAGYWAMFMLCFVTLHYTTLCYTTF